MSPQGEMFHRSVTINTQSHFAWQRESRITFLINLNISPRGEDWEGGGYILPRQTTEDSINTTFKDRAILLSCIVFKRRYNRVLQKLQMTHKHQNVAQAATFKSSCSGLLMSVRVYFPQIQMVLQYTRDNQRANLFSMKEAPSPIISNCYS
jgi:hypothetical protein